MKQWIRQRIRKTTRVYIFPTKMGGYLNGLIFLLFLLSVGYSNNLLLIFTLFLFGLNIMWLISSHFYMRRLEFQGLQIADGHAGEFLDVTLFWKRNSPDQQLKIVLENQGAEFNIEHLHDRESESSGQVFLKERGVQSWKYLKIMTDRPFGLYQTWKFLPLSQISFTYPPLLKDFSLPSRRDFPLDGEALGEKKGHQDLNSLNPYQGEGIKRISWKHYARSGDLLIKEGLDPQESIVEFKLELPEDASLKENYLSILATQMNLCAQKETPFTFETPSFKRGPSFHRRHLQECLKELAQC